MSKYTRIAKTGREEGFGPHQIPKHYKAMAIEKWCIFGLEVIGRGYIETDSCVFNKCVVSPEDPTSSVGLSVPYDTETVSKRRLDPCLIALNRSQIQVEYKSERKILNCSKILEENIYHLKVRITFLRHKAIIKINNLCVTKGYHRRQTKNRKKIFA